MRKKIGTGLILGFLAVNLAVTPCYASSAKDKISAAQNAQKKNQKQLNDANGRINSLESKKGDLEEYLSELSRQLKELEKNLQEIQNQSEKKQKELDKLEIELGAALEREAEQYSSMKLRIQYMYENASSSYIVKLLESKSLAEFLTQAENMAQLTRFDRDMLGKYKETTKEIETKENQIKKEQEELEELKEESLDKQDEISEVEKNTYNQIAVYERQISAEQSNAKSLLAQIESQKNTIDSLIKQQKDEEAAEILEQEKENNNNNAGKPAEKPQKPESKPETKPETKPDPKPETKPEEKPSDNTGNSSKGKYLGKFKLTAYCSCTKCCGPNAIGITASGTRPVQGRTVAMGGLPFGTKLSINGSVYIVEDRGTPYGHIDIYFGSHQAALQFGAKSADVYQLN